MSCLEITAEEIESKRLETQRRLNSSASSLKSRLRKYEEASGKDCTRIYDAVIDAFTHQAAVYDFLLGELRGEDNKFAQSNVYSVYVGSVYGTEICGNLEERTLKTKSFFEGCDVDLTATSPLPSSKLMDIYTEVIRVCTESKEYDLESITSEFFQWMYEQTQRYQEDKFMLGLQMRLSKTPLVIKEKNGTEKKFSNLKKEESTYDTKEYSWDMIGGYEREKEICKGYEDCIRHFAFMVKRQKNPIPRGIILYGPPGTGKTTIAKIIATEAGVPYEYLSRQDIASSFKDGSPLELAKVFAKAKSYITKGLAPASVLILDEIDSILAKRDSKEREHSNEVSVVLTEMDGKYVPGLIVIGATNNFGAIDPAFLRPGRFEMSLEIGLPNLDARADIFKVIAKEAADYAFKNNNGEKLLGKIDYVQLGEVTEGLAGDHIRRVVEKTIRNQSLDFSRNGTKIKPLTTNDFLETIDYLESIRQLRGEESGV